MGTCMKDLIRMQCEHAGKPMHIIDVLHLEQNYIERISRTLRSCINLKTLLLQGNLIRHTNNIFNLHKVHTINIAINRIDTIKNYHHCRNLENLDLSMNYIRNLYSVCNLNKNKKLRSLCLVGNPCAEYHGYRPYVIHNVPQLEILDDRLITPAEREQADRDSHIIENIIGVQMTVQGKFRSEQRKRMTACLQNEELRNATMEDCPEMRLAIGRKCKLVIRKRDAQNMNVGPKPLFSDDGEPLYVNEAKYFFNIVDNSEVFCLRLEIYKHIHTRLIRFEITRKFLRVYINGEIFQLRLPDDINVSKYVAVRNECTGLVVFYIPKYGEHTLLETIYYCQDLKYLAEGINQMLGTL